MMQIGNKSIDNHVTILLKFYDISCTIIGLKKIKMVQGKITYPGNLYKAYCIVLWLTMCALVKIALREYYMKYIQILPFPLFFSQFANFFVVLFGFIAIFLSNFYFSNESYLKMFNLLSKATCDLDFDCPKRLRHFKKSLILFHAIIVFLKLLILIPDLVQFKTFITLPGQFMVFVHDLKTAHFVIETNLVARLVENINSKLELLSKNGRSKKNGFMMKIWKSNCIIDKIDTHSANGSFFKLIKKCNVLFDIVENLNSSYAFLVSQKYLILIKSKLLICE